MKMFDFEQLKKDCQEYATKNPVRIYGSYDDELPDDIIEAILDGENDKAYELMSEAEFNMSMYYQYCPITEAFKSWLKDTQHELSEDQETELLEIWQEYCFEDYSDFWDTCFSNTSAQIAVTLYDENDEPIYGPNHEFDEKDNKESAAYLERTLGITNDPGICYSNEILKIGGTFDLKVLLEKGLPDSIKISPNDSDNLLFHSSMQGSGSLGSMKVTKEHTFKCGLKNDKTNKYGIDAVYGFTRVYWGYELDFIWKE